MTPSNTTPKKEFNYADGVTLREFLEARLDAMDKAVSVSRATMETRLEGMNEFRNTLRDQAGHFITRQELAVMLSKIHSDIDDLKTYRDTMQGKASQSSVMIALIFAVISAVIGIINMFSP
jgi:hypothetical protein